MRTFSNRVLPLVGLLVAGLLLAPYHAGAATIVINNNDGPGEGFNDPTVVPALPGNPNTTLGAQRLYAFTYAANIWGQCLISPVTIVVNAQMNPQFCDPTSAVLGSAGATTVHANFGGAPKVNTWYPAALANSLNGSDLNGATPDINATFNSSINNDPGCLGGYNWYYGTDQNPPAFNIDFITVVAHEIGHGLGFQTFQSQAGVWFSGLQDTYGTNMYHGGAAPPDYPSMTNAQRGICNISDPSLRWDGACVKLTAPTILTAGGGGLGRARLHGPSPYQPGSSLSHWSTALAPDQLMEPFYAGPNHTITLELQLLKDCGWVLAPKGPVATAITAFEVRPGSRGVEITAEFYSDAGQFAVNVFRGEGSAQPTVLIHGEDLNNGARFNYTDLEVVPGREYSYQISVQDHDGQFFSPKQTITVPTARTSLAQNVPNPFNPVTTISYSLPAAQDMTLSIYDAQGRLVRTLVSGAGEPGPHEVAWDGRDNNGTAVGTGVYFYRLVSGTFAESKKMVLLK